MAKRTMETGSNRRTFIKRAVLGAAGLSTLDLPPAANADQAGKKCEAKYDDDSSVAAVLGSSTSTRTVSATPITFPREFTDRHLARIAFPVGGIGTGGVEIGGRGDLRLWQICNRPESGDTLRYVFAAVHVARSGKKPFTSMLERRLLPPYDLWDYRDGVRGVGALEMPRMAEATFRSSFPVAEVSFADPGCPAQISLTAFSPFCPVDADDSGLPVAVFEYTARNSTHDVIDVSLALSSENPCVGARHGTNVLRTFDGADTPSGIFMSNPTLAEDDPKRGSFALVALPEPGQAADLLAMWPNLGGVNDLDSFWRVFRKQGRLPRQEDALDNTFYPIASASIRASIAPGGSASLRFLMAWHYPNRTPEQIGWSARKGMSNVNLGNFYATRFRDAWDVSEYTVKNLPELKAKTIAFVETMRHSTLPEAVKDAAASNLSTLVSNTSFRIADGSFHGFEGCSKSGGQGPGSCTHVWNYEVATTFVFPVLSRSMRETSFDYATQQSGHMDFRHKLPLGQEHFGLGEEDHEAAADGQMGQIVRLYLDWRISGDTAWMLKRWPGAKRALAFAWIKGGWDANRDGVMEGAQHNTYDVEFIGPSGVIQSWYLAALRASAMMAKAANDIAFSSECERMESIGSEWTDKHLFQGEFYIQQIRPTPQADVDPRLLSGLNTADPRNQLGSACHIDQIVGQCIAGLAGLGNLLSPENMRIALHSIHRYNPRLAPAALTGTHRMYAINDEPALNICAYPNQEGMPVNPVGYACENWCGLEYAVAATMIQYGMVDEAIEHVTNVRARHDGERRNPMDEFEWGHHYARSMASWALIPALSGFRHDAVLEQLIVQPRMNWQSGFRSPWTANRGWGELRLDANGMTITVVAGELVFLTLELPVLSHPETAALGGSEVQVMAAESNRKGCKMHFAAAIRLTPQSPFHVNFRRNGRTMA